MQIDSILIRKSLNEYACIFKLLPVEYEQICKLSAFNNIAFQDILISLIAISQKKSIHLKGIHKNMIWDLLKMGIICFPRRLAKTGFNDMFNGSGLT